MGDVGTPARHPLPSQPGQTRGLTTAAVVNTIRLKKKKIHVLIVIIPYTCRTLQGFACLSDNRWGECFRERVWTKQCHPVLSAALGALLWANPRRSRAGLARLRARTRVQAGELQGARGGAGK